MPSFIGRRVIQLLFVLFFLSLVTFVLMKLAPGDPVLAILHINEVAITRADEQALREQMGLDRPIPVQYVKWLSGVLQLDIGTSYLNDKPVTAIIADRLPATLQLTAAGLFVMVLIAFPLGLLAAKYPGRFPDHLSRFIALLGASIPNFWFGMLLIYFLAYKLKWLPTMGTGGLQHIILPSVTLGFSMAAVYARLLRSGLLDSLSQEYIRAVRARGIAEWRIMMKHALRAALLPVVTVFGISLGNLLAGTVVVEILFSWPGLGSLAVDAIYQRDYPVIQGYVLLTGGFVVIVNLLVDLSYGLLDPRIRYGKGEME